MAYKRYPQFYKINMKTQEIVRELILANYKFFIGVPDSTLKGLTEILDRLGEVRNITAANEGIALSIAAGYSISTGNIPVVYLQNSGIGNLLNPMMSLIHKKVFDIPVLLIIGWRGMPGVKDEPQHLPQGEITLSLLDLMSIPYKIVKSMDNFKEIMYMQQKLKRTVAIIIPPNFLEYKSNFHDHEDINKLRKLTRYKSIESVLENLNSTDIVVSTTGKTSRELYEISKIKNFPNPVFMNIGSMGHASSFALGLTIGQESNRVVVLDGDGALQMHLGSLLTNSSQVKNNFLHIVLANETHESVGGSKLAKNNLDYKKLFTSVGYDHFLDISTKSQIDRSFAKIKKIQGKIALIIRINNNPSNQIGRPSESPIEQKNIFISKI